MHKLNLPEYDLKIKTANKKTQIFDAVRKKYVSLTPEEWVRQHIIRFLIESKGVPASLIAIEKGLSYNKLKKRSDVLVYDRNGLPYLLVECKAPKVKITQETFHQIARYNRSLHVKYLVVTNGLNHFCCEMDYIKMNYSFLDDIPSFL